MSLCSKTGLSVQQPLSLWPGACFLKKVLSPKPNASMVKTMFVMVISEPQVRF